MIYVAKEVDLEKMGIDKYLKTQDENLETIKKIDKDAKEKGMILYRYLTFPYADGNAVYQIIKVNKKTVKIQVCTGIGDDWIVPYIGEVANIPLETALTELKNRDKWDNL